MKVDIIAIGKIKEAYLREAIGEYVKRLKPYTDINIIECMEEKMPENPAPAEKTKVLQKEGEKLLKAIKGQPLVVALDQQGFKMTSEELAGFIAEKTLSGKSHITFVIGGAYGLDTALKGRSDMQLSFSDFTFTHQMIRLLLAEQVYRAFKIINNEKYHN